MECALHAVEVIDQELSHSKIYKNRLLVYPLENI